MLNLIAVLIFAAVSLGLVAWKRAARAADADEPYEETPERETFLDRWERMARYAGLNWTRQVYFAAVGGSLALAAMLAWAGQLNWAIVTGLVGPVVPYVYVRRMQAARASALVRQIPQALFLASSVLRAGGTLLQAVETIAAEMPDPIGGEFVRIQQQMQLQVPAYEALAEAQQRVGLREFAAVVVATRITADVGGNLAHIFDQLSRSLVEAQNARRMIQSFTTEGRMSANLIAALPFAVMGLLHLLSPGYFEPLFTTWSGRLVLASCLGAIGVGWATIRRMVDIQMF